MKRYSFVIEIEEGNSEFWEMLNADNHSLNNKYLAMEIISSLSQNGWTATVKPIGCIEEVITTFTNEPTYSETDLERYMNNA